jgi:hypothetical protein
LQGKEAGRGRAGRGGGFLRILYCLSRANGEGGKGGARRGRARAVGDGRRVSGAEARGLRTAAPCACACAWFWLVGLDGGLGAPAPGFLLGGLGLGPSGDPVHGACLAVSAAVG